MRLNLFPNFLHRNFNKKTISNVKLYLLISVFSTDKEAKWMKLCGKYTKLRIHAVKAHTQVLHCQEEI
jgi:hypothetical protein